MKLFYLIAVMANIAFSANLPGTLPQALSPRQISKNSTLNTTSAVTANTSLLYGWHLAGASLSPTTPTQTCNNLSSLDPNNKYLSIGLNPSLIASPSCLSQSFLLNASAAIPGIAHYATELYISQLLSALSADDLGYFCQNMDPKSVDQVGLNGTRVKEVVCEGQDVGLPFIAGADNSGTIAWAKEQGLDHSSQLFAHLYALSSASAVEAEELCTQMGYLTPLLYAEGLDADAVRATVCNTAGLVDVVTGRKELVEGLSLVFASQMVGSGCAAIGGYWAYWLCGHLSVEGMDGSLLDGALVKEVVCYSPR